jgi:hypothetical protein
MPIVLITISQKVSLQKKAWAVKKERKKEKGQVSK